ncbi:MAG: DNA-binding protein [Oscillospiraceae bacterium]|nr:DNA-binding protein [Oscillospiraceae bacterium]
MDLDWQTPEEAGKKWGIKVRRVQTLCSNGRVDGAIRLGRVWLIPKETSKPIDARTRAARKQSAH